MDSHRLVGNVAIEVELDDGVPASSPVSRTTAAARTSDPASARWAASCADTATPAIPGFEGVVRDGVIGTYLHGPLLPKNAWFADWLIARCTGTRLGAARRRVGERGALRRPAERPVWVPVDNSPPPPPRVPL